MLCSVLFSDGSGTHSIGALVPGSPDKVRVQYGSSSNVQDVNLATSPTNWHLVTYRIKSGVESLLRVNGVEAPACSASACKVWPAATGEAVLGRGFDGYIYELSCSGGGGVVCVCLVEFIVDLLAE